MSSIRSIVRAVFGIAVTKAHYSTDSKPVQYGLWVELDKADDSALIYLARVLLCMASCNLTLVRIQVKYSWSASTQTWKTIDEVLLQLGQHTLRRISLLIHPSVDVPSWEVLPYECEDHFIQQVLPKCVTAGIIDWAKPQHCRLHNPQRWRLATQGALSELLDVFRAWNCPVKWWEITLQSTPVESESVGDLWCGTREMWKEISRVFALSLLARPTCVCIVFRMEGLGAFVLGVVAGALRSHLSWRADLIVSQVAIPPSTGCGLSSTTQMKMRWSTWFIFSHA